MIVVWLTGGYLVILLLKAGLALRVARHERAAVRTSGGGAPLSNADTADLSDVAIAQPILAGDPGLSDTLEANLRALPSAHFIWLVDTDDPAAQDICTRLRHRHAGVRIDILTLPPAADGENPKLFKLSRARPLIRERVLVVLDDDTRMPAESASAMISALDRRDLATALPGYLDDGGWASRLLAQFVNNNAALAYLPLLNVMPAFTINGMAYALEIATLDRLGGFAPLIGSVTDDLALAGRVRAIGGRIWQTASPVWVQTTIGGGRQYLRQMHRWHLFALILVAWQPARRQLLIGGLNAAPAALLWSVAVAAGARSSLAAFVALACLLGLRGAVVAALQRTIYGRPIHRPLWSVASELLQPLHLAHALLRRTIVWRTRRYRVSLNQTFRIVR